MKKLLYLIFLMMLFSCVKSKNPPPTVIQPKEMQSILWDVMRAETLSSEIGRKDSSVDVAIQTKFLSQKVFKIHKTDSATFNKSYNWYLKHPDILKIIFDSLYVQKERENNLESRKKHVPASMVK